MEAKELRIGNLVQGNKGSLFNGEIVEVDEVFFIQEFFLEYVKPIPLTEEWLNKLGFEYWDEIEVNEYESFKRYVLFNVVEGTSNYEVHLLETTYGKTNENDIMYSIDVDERQHINETKYVHNLQNAFYQATGEELIIKI